MSLSPGSHWWVKEFSFSAICLLSSAGTSRSNSEYTTSSGDRKLRCRSKVAKAVLTIGVSNRTDLISWIWVMRFKGPLKLCSRKMLDLTKTTCWQTLQRASRGCSARRQRGPWFEFLELQLRSEGSVLWES